MQGKIQLFFIYFSLSTLEEISQHVLALSYSFLSIPTPPSEPNFIHNLPNTTVNQAFNLSSFHAPTSQSTLVIKWISICPVSGQRDKKNATTTIIPSSLYITAEGKLQNLIANRNTCLLEIPVAGQQVLATEPLLPEELHLSLPSPPICSLLWRLWLNKNSSSSKQV